MSSASTKVDGHAMVSTKRCSGTERSPLTFGSLVPSSCCFPLLNLVILLALRGCNDCGIVPYLGPTSLAPIIETATKVVQDHGYQYHILLIIADGQVCTPFSVD